MMRSQRRSVSNAMNDIIQTRFAESAQSIQEAAPRLGPRLEQAAQLIIQAYQKGGGVIVFGNGGSAADAQHIAGELVGRFLRNRPPLKAIALTTDSSVLTCLANDFDYESIFARQLQANAGPHDVAVGLSTSGNSPNVIAALTMARQMGLRTIAFTGQGGGRCAALADILLDVPTAFTPHVQQVHMVMYHILCELVEARVPENG